MRGSVVAQALTAVLVLLKFSVYQSSGLRNKENFLMNFPVF